jgi:hypothetical protein
LTTPSFNRSQQSLYYRIITLWVLNEALLGGIIHGLRIPVSGLVIGSVAVICITLIAWYHPAKGAIIKATIIVAIFKMMLSPQAPLPAYFAVFFQGILGELFFSNRKWFKLSCFLLAVLALLESGLQRIITLTIIYGKDLWTALDQFINGFIQTNDTEYSYFIIAWYLLFHIIAGVIVGLWAGLLPQRIILWKHTYGRFLILKPGTNSAFAIPLKKNKWKKGMLLIWIVLILIYVQSTYKIGPALLPPSIVWRLILRSVIIVFAWYFLISPLLKFLLNKWLQKQQTKSQEHLKAVMNLLPAFQELVAQSWKLSAEKRGYLRLRLCCIIILVNTFSSPIE